MQRAHNDSLETAGKSCYVKDGLIIEQRSQRRGDRRGDPAADGPNSSQLGHEEMLSAEQSFKHRCFSSKSNSRAQNKKQHKTVAAGDGERSRARGLHQRRRKDKQLLNGT